MSDEPDSLPSLSSMDCWDYTVELECLDGIQDLRLAAELGQTLLERNKELEISLQQHQNLVEDQSQKIEYLTKQSAALREVNNSRLRIYEQLEVSIQELERANHRLVLENSAEKKRIKTSNATVESLESKCEDLQSTIDDLKLQLEALKRKSQHDSDAQSPTRTKIKSVEAEEKRDDSKTTDVPDSVGRTPTQEEKSRCIPYPAPQPAATTTEQPKSADSAHQTKEDFCETDSIVEQLLNELRKTRTQCTRDERRITELEEQLSTMVQQNQALENQVIELAHREEDLNVKSMHEELISLDEVRLGQTCSRCLRSIDYNSSSEVIDDDDVSIVEAIPTLRSSFNMDVQDYPDNQSSPIKKQFENPYKDLVEKYESLVEGRKSVKPNRVLSPQEELQMSGDYKALSTDEESGHGDSLQTEKHHKTTRKTLSSPTDFSEAETNSSGFTDETSNKFTQTDGLLGSLLCTIADGDNYQFSIYDNANPIDSRFQEIPEYRNVFKEVFHVLKDAAEKKQRGVDLPLLDEYTPVKLAPCLDQTMDFPDDDSQSVVSTMSELSISQTEPTTVMENVIQFQYQPEPQANAVQERVLRPLMRNNLEYVSVEVRKRSSSRRKNKFSERSDSPVTHIIGSPKISYSSKPIGRNRREQSKNASPDTTLNSNSTLNSSGSSAQFDPSDRVASPTPSQCSVSYEFKPSSASQDLNKLKRLDLSYAQVLSKADNTMIRLSNSGKASVMRSVDSAAGNMLRGKQSGRGNARKSSRSNSGGNSSRFSKNRPM